MVAEFYGVIHAMMFDLNVIIPWFVLHLLLGLMFCECFVIDDSYLNYCGKIRFKVTRIFREGNACVDKLTNL